MNAKNSKKRKLAIFDIDGTIFRSSLLIELINELVSDGVFPKKAKKEMEKDYLAWINRKGNYDSYIMQVVKIHLKYIGGCKRKDINKVVKKVISWQKDRVYRFTRDLIKKLKKENYFLVAISGSPGYVVADFSKYLGFDISYGSVYEIKNGVFTGGVENKDTIENKKKVLEDFIKQASFEVDLKKSIGVGDTDSDIPFLKMVGIPIAFNPNRTFVQYAKKKKWKVVVERKDTIYEIKDFSLKNH